jgi:hypothetical protein
VTCRLCYRSCELNWCRARTNVDGQNLPTDVGVLGCVVRQIRG